MPRFTRLSLLLLSGGLLLLAGSGLFTFCTTSYNCPAYDDAIFRAWFPYTEGQLITWTDGSGGIDTVRVAEVNMSDAYSGKSAKPLPCASSGEVMSADTMLYDRRFHIREARSEGKSVALDIFYRDFRLFTNGLTDTSIELYGYSGVGTETQYNVTLGNHSYSRLQSLYRTDTSAAIAGQIYKVYLSRGYGLVGYELYPSHKRWYLP